MAPGVKEHQAHVIRQYQAGTYYQMEAGRISSIEEMWQGVGQQQ
jgi:hypothetical protein